MQGPGWLRHRRLSTKVVAAIVLASSAVTLVVTAIQLFVDYRRDVGALEQDLREARNSFSATLGASLWALDEDQLELQLRGLHQLPHVTRVTLSGDMDLRVGNGDDYPYQRAITIPVQHRTRDGVLQELGTVRVTASLAGIHARIRDRLAVIVSTQAAKTFVVSLLLLALLYALVIRHLQTLSGYARALRLDRLHAPAALARPANGPLRPDELDEVALSLNYATARMTEEMEARRNAEGRNRLLAETLEQAPAAILIMDADGVPDYVNPPFERFSGRTAEELRGRRCFGPDGSLTRAVSVVQGPADPWASLRETDAWQGEICMRGGDGGYRWGRAAARLVRSAGTTHYVVVVEDLTDLRTVEERLDYQTHFDALTGLPNRQLMQQFLAALLGPEGDRACAVVLLDVDHFKAINESVGPDGGDRVLRIVGERLRTLVEPGWQIGRFGNDEFILVLPGAWDTDALRARIETLIRELREVRFLDEQPFVLSLTAGAAVGPYAGTRVAEMLRAADAALYAAKRTPAHGVGVFDHADHRPTQRRLTLDADLHRALAHHEFVLHFQPIVDVPGGRVHALEALIRWEHPEQGLVPPDEFIGLAEDNGLIVPLGEWVLREGLARLADLRRRPGLEALRLAINVSPRQLADGQFPDAVRAALETTGVPAEALQVEITERVFLGEVEQSGRALETLEGLGVELAIDDFGTGYSSLSYLGRLRVDVLKIDRCFVRELCDETAPGAQLVPAIIALGHNLGVAVVAEGVEREAELERLRALGCDYAQGFHIARPLPPDELDRALGTAGHHA